MRTDRHSRALPLPARRVFRLALTTALALTASYAMDSPLPYLAPIFAFILTARPAPPISAKGLIGVLVLVLFTTGLGLSLVPVLTDYRVVGLVVVLLGLYLANDLSLNRGKGPVGTFLTIGLTLITAAGVAYFEAARTVVEALITGIITGVISQRIIYPLFPEDPAPEGAAPPTTPQTPIASSWLAVRAALIVFPAFWLGLVNPGLYLPIIMKSVSLGQQASEVRAREAGRELLLSTLCAAWFAMLFWVGLKINPSLWMFFLWTVLFVAYFAAKLYGVLESRFPASFWGNVVVTLFILVGPAVADSANGKDVYKASAVRLALFVMLAVYAWLAIIVLERLRERRLRPSRALRPALGGA